MYQNQNQNQLTFRKSSYSATQNDCVEVADMLAGAAIQDTKNRGGGYLPFPSGEWSALLATVRDDNL